MPIIVRCYRSILSAKKYLVFIRQFRLLANAAEATQRLSMRWADRLPCLTDDTTQTGFDAHYVYHTSWAARVLARTRPTRHIDISSDLRFVTIASAFVPITFYDYRPAHISLDGLATDRADINKLPFKDKSVASLSCMHVIEHIGLGRYGDAIDYNGDLKAVAELRRVIAKKGNLLFVVPVGRPRIVFNAHRIYSYDQVMELFPDFELIEFALVTDSGHFIPRANRETVPHQSYGCGCFWLRKS